MKTLKFYLTNRFILFLFSILVFIVFNYLFTGKIFPSTETKDIWFYAGLFMVLFSVLFIEPFYSSPKNVITNSIPLLLVYLSNKQSFKSDNIWWVSFILILLLITISIVAMALSQSDQSEDSLRNKISTRLKSIVIVLGKGKVLFSAVFLSIIFLYKIELLEKVTDTYFFLLIILWGIFLLIDTKSIHSSFISDSMQTGTNEIGEVFSVQSNNMFLIRLFADKISIKNFDVVCFKYQMDDSSDNINYGFVFDTYNLNRQKWAKILLLKKKDDNSFKLKRNIIYNISDLESNNQIKNELRIETFVGIVTDGSKIGLIKFEYSKKTNDLQEGDLIELFIDSKKIFYQVIGGITNSEKLENKDKSGFIIGEAIQLGIWNNESLSFEKYGWVPYINTPLFRAITDDIEVPEFNLPEFKLGVIPNTTLPSVMNLNDAISHHIALLGVTGAGKSYLAREIIRELIKDTNVICIDFTGEYKKDLGVLNPFEIIKLEGLTQLEETFAEKHQKSLAKQPAEELKLKKQIQEKLKSYVEAFILGKDNLGLFELPALSNTSFILEFTQFFVESVFNYAKETPNSKICLVLEEAHTIVPETGFLGDLGDYGSTKALVNKMSQIALQGRKYGVGLMVIAQRTANVSKTVLTQCNTIICFQAFDDTSFTFLGNYIGKDLVQALPNLKRYHAIVTGKAIKSNIPMIVNLERKQA